ncbi:unnamed protein product [Cunninghamella blakesleeana]
MQGLFSSYSPPVVARCANNLMRDTSFNNRPDYVLTSCPSNLAVLDFYRVAIFCKDALDKDNPTSAIAFTIKGIEITFFILNLFYNNIHTLLELFMLDIPTRKKNSVNIIGYIDHLFTIIKLHHSSVPSTNTNISHSLTALFNYIRYYKTTVTIVMTIYLSTVYP